MSPRDLKAEMFASYGPAARATAIENLDLLRQLPLAFVPFLLKEISALDWEFPAEQRQLLDQLAYLLKLSPENRERAMAPFASLRLSPALEEFDFVNHPAQFLEKLSAHLWATAQMDGFRSSSEDYMHAFRAAYPDPPPVVPRLAVVLIGRDAEENPAYPLFRKLRREGTLFRQVDGAHGLELVEQVLRTRAATTDRDRFAHWFIDGAAASVASDSAHLFTLISYDELAGVRRALNARIREAFETRMSPEALRSELAATTPQSLGIAAPAGNECLDRFKVSLFTEGSGTQIYSTTFVQWTAREALRRAQPVTLVARFAPRQREASMAELLNAGAHASLDPAGSLIDADMGAWYTWISLQRLKGADQSRFVAWFEGHHTAVAVGPQFARGAENDKPISLRELIS